MIITSLIGPQSSTRHECDLQSKADQDLKLWTTENIGPLITAFKGRSVNNERSYEGEKRGYIIRDKSRKMFITSLLSAAMKPSNS